MDTLPTGASQRVRLRLRPYAPNGRWPDIGDKPDFPRVFGPFLCCVGPTASSSSSSSIHPSIHQRALRLLFFFCFLFRSPSSLHRVLHFPSSSRRKRPISATASPRENHKGETDNQEEIAARGPFFRGCMSIQVHLTLLTRSRRRHMTDTY
ncbi:hypothetical protein BKA80DRAFT_286998 [Phyllosticta citrichinensis]